LIISNPEKKILFVSYSYYGSCHDYSMLKEEFNPNEGVWFDDKEVYVDLGFLGIQKDYCQTVKIP